MEAFRRTNTNEPIKKAPVEEGSADIPQELKTTWEAFKGLFSSGGKREVNRRSPEFLKKMKDDLTENQKELQSIYPDPSKPEVMQKIADINKKISTLESAINQWHNQ
jgi:hypothetical protein